MDESAAALEAEWGLEPSGKEAKPLPPRRRTHPSNKQQMTRWFYRLLIVLFLALLSACYGGAGGSNRMESIAVNPGEGGETC